MHRLALALCASCLLLAGCTATVGTATAEAGAPGYQFHDANHPNDVSNPSPQAIQNAMHGTWLWPPQSGDWP